MTRTPKIATVFNGDDQGGLSVFASSQFDLDYVEIDSATLLSGDSKNIFSSDRAHKLPTKVRRDRGRLVVVLGCTADLATVLKVPG